MQQFEDDSALPFADVGENEEGYNNGAGQNQKKNYIKQKDEQNIQAGQKASLDQQLNSYKKNNSRPNLIQNSMQQKGSSQEKNQLRNNVESYNQSVPSLPRINISQNISLDKPQKRYSQNMNQSDTQTIANLKNTITQSNIQLQLNTLNFFNKQGNTNTLTSSVGGYNQPNMAINSVKFQKNLFKAIQSSTSQSGGIFTQREDKFGFPISNYQIQVDPSSLSANKYNKNLRSTTTNFNTDLMRKSVHLTTESSTDGLNNNGDYSNRAQVQSKIKEQSHEIYKMISPNAYKVLKMKQIKNNPNDKDIVINQMNKTQLMNNYPFSPNKMRFSSQVLDGQQDELDVRQQQVQSKDISMKGIKTLRDLKEWKNPAFQNKESLVEQVEFIKNSLQKPKVNQKKSKNAHSITSLQDLQYHENQLGVQNIQYEKGQPSFAGMPQIQVQGTDQDHQFHNKLLSTERPSTNQYLYAPSMVSQFNPQDNNLNESALLTQDKVSIIKEMNQKNNNKTNFYGQFISKCLETTQFDSKYFLYLVFKIKQILFKNQANNTPLKNIKKKEIFETDFEKIKVSSQLLDIIDKQVFQENEHYEQSQTDNIPHQAQIPNSQKSPQKKVVLNPKQKEKLFQVLAESDKIVIHTSQNKDLMVPSERKDVVRLAQWLEEMLIKIYNIQELDFYEYFENMQLVCSACMSELIRQIGLSVQERGQLVKRVWESILNLMKQAFEQVTYEKTENERNLKEEIKGIHKSYLKKIDEYLPEIERYKKLVEQKEQQNKRVVLEFRYLRKKDTKLEKYLKLAKKDLRSVEDEYQKLDQDFQSFKKSYERQEQSYIQTIANLKQLQKSQQQLASVLTQSKKEDNKFSTPSERFSSQVEQKQTDTVSPAQKEQNKFLTEESEQIYNNHLKTYEQISKKANSGIENFHQNFETYNQDIKQLHDKYVKDLKQLQKNTNVSMQDIDQIEDDLYANKEEMNKILQVDERVIEEIEGSDGITLLIAHCSTQTGSDLIKKVHQSVDTSTLYQQKDKTTQTFVREIDVKEVQTPQQWMQNIQSPSNVNDKNSKGVKPSKFSSMSKMDSDNEIEENEQELKKQKEEIEKQDQIKLEKMKIIINKTADQEKEERQKLQELPFVKQFLIDSPMLEKSGLLFSWKDDERRKSRQSKQNSQNALPDELNEESGSDSFFSYGSEEEVHELPNEGILTAENSPNSNLKKIKKIRESLSKTIQNNVEKDLDDLHTLVMSRTSYVTSLCEKIINHELLKQNEHVTTQMIQQFINDSKQIIFEEHSRLKRIWERSKKGILDQVKSKIIIAEKDAEIQEVQNDKEIVEQQIKFFRKEAHFEDKKNEGVILTDRKKGTYNSFADITDEFESDDYDDENNHNSSNDDDNGSDNRSQSESVFSNNDTSTLIKQDGSAQKQDTTTTKKEKNKGADQLLPPREKKNSVAGKKQGQSAEKQQPHIIIPPMNISTKLSPPPVLQMTSSALASKRQKKKQTLNPLNRVSISLIEAVQGSKTQPKPEGHDQKNQLTIEKRFIEFSSKKKEGISSFTNIGQQNNMGASIIMGASNIMGGSSINNSNQVNWLKTLNIKKQKLMIHSQSPNADSAAYFFNKIAFKIINKEINKGKTVIMKQQNVLKHIQSIYQDKIKSLKGNDEEQNGGSRTLNLVAYDYFLNQFGFKKLAETKLKQFLESCVYYNVAFKIRMFTKLYGVNKIMNYDFDDFDFYIKMMVYLEEGSSAQQIQANIYPINRALEALFRNFETKIPASEMLRLKQEMENMKIPDSTSKQKHKFAIDSDHALDILLQALIEEKKIQIQNIQSVYLAGDINCDQVIAFDEYLTLFRHFESNCFDIMSVTKFYYQNCDLLDRFTNSRIMSFQKFTLTSVSGDLFTKEIQDNYAAKIESFDRIKNIEILEKHWEDKKDVIRLRFVKNGSYKLFYRQMIKRIDDHFALNKDQRNQLEKNTTWFVYRLLDDESKRIMTEQSINSYLPKEFSIFTSFQESFIEKICLNV